jgi:mRNA-degrading endonuclease RelE of RelBE toxin-antitoxin system
MSRYRVVFAPATRDHFRHLTARQRAIVLRIVDRQLSEEPDVVTRNRKPMRPNELAVWELRIGRLRVYYEIQDEPEPAVHILAVGLKLRNRVDVGGRVYEL